MTIDVTLVLEGTYPYVTGGVSTWVDGLVRGLPDLGFAVVHLRDEEAPRRAARALPANVCLVLDVDVDPERPGGTAGLHDVPDGAVVHALSSGTAAVPGAALARARGVPLVLTEHGLAWREALNGTGELESGRPPAGARRPAARAEARLAWARDLAAMARTGYAEATAITTVCSANARRQRRLGAPAARSAVTHNGVAARWLQGAPAAGPGAGEGPLFVLVGRVVPIKDTMGFLEAARLVLDAEPRARFAVVGPLDQDPDYAGGCLTRSADLGLEAAVRFTGEADPCPWVAAATAVVLSSVSEAQPLALLEAMASGVPVVAPRVGGCPELVHGVEGDAGLLTVPGDPMACARAMLRLAADDGLRARMGAAGRARAGRRHGPHVVPSAYRRVYERALADRGPA